MDTIHKVKVENMTSARGHKAVPNQFVITTEEGEYFQSYQSVIVFKPLGEWRKGMSNAKIVLDEKYWDYSSTTGRYRNEFLGEQIAETRRKIESGEYVLANLNS